MELNRQSAWDLLCEYTKTESLRKHALGVEAAMRAMAMKYESDPELWGITGLLHDFDYEKYPTAEEHPYKGVEILKTLGYPQEVLDAIMGHAEYTGVERKSLMAKSLFAVDELVGFIFAVTYVRPSRAVREVMPKSVRKKLKQKSFAASVNRADIVQGIQELELEENEHFQFVIDALTGVAESVGLAGSNTE
ncbi:MAG: HDIG domain-containing protein [Candidatus Marinimicrobia bacterium]|nr:HDIG domain-containing protein [Candidatus Neomarinimicrobiota bacterium]MCF7922950.1 HDIG domain-containing protein [Candidatus Neomarinimicrobiota bacterium]